MNGSATVFVMLTVAILPLAGVLLAVTPWLMRREECFTVTVPADAQNDPEVRALKRGYSLAMGAATLAVTVLDAVLFALGLDVAGLVVLVAACLLLTGLSFGLMLRARSRVRALKERRGWKAAGDLRSAVVAEGDVPRPVSLWWELLHLPIIAATLAVGCACYAAMPDLVPMQVGFDGQVNRWAEKSVELVLFTPGVQAFLAIVMAFTHWSILRSKRPNAPKAPVSSAYAYGSFARAQSAYLAALGLVLNAALVCIPLSMAGVVSLLAAGIGALVVALGAVVGAVVLAVKYGQSGALVMPQVGDGGDIAHDEDRYWKLGVLYVNGDDPSLFVPARFGVGWTCNFGRPAAWALMAGIVALTVAFLVFVFAVA